jgi:hypothetical protein
MAHVMGRDASEARELDGSVWRGTRNALSMTCVPRLCPVPPAAGPGSRARSGRGGPLRPASRAHHTPSSNQDLAPARS